MVCYGAQFVTKRPEAGRRFIKAYLQGVRDYNDALKDGRIAGPDAEDVVDAIARYSVTKDRDLIRIRDFRRTPDVGLGQKQRRGCGHRRHVVRESGRG